MNDTPSVIHYLTSKLILLLALSFLSLKIFCYTGHHGAIDERQSHPKRSFATYPRRSKGWNPVCLRVLLFFILNLIRNIIADCGSLLAIGGVGTTPPEHWTNSKGELWLGTLDANSAPDIGILSFPNRLAASGALFGRDVEEEGASLLTELHHLAEDETVHLSYQFTIQS